MFWKSKEVEPPPQEIKESQKDGGKEELFTEENNGGVRNIILNVMKFLEDGEVIGVSGVLTRDGIWLSAGERREGVYSACLMVEKGIGEWREVQLSEQEQSVLTSFYFETYDAIKEREKQKESEEALEIINNTMLQAKK